MAGHFATPRAQRRRVKFTLPSPANLPTRPRPRFAVVRVSPIPRVAARVATRRTALRTGRVVFEALNTLAGITPAGRGLKLSKLALDLLIDWGPDVAAEFGLNWVDLFKPGTMPEFLRHPPGLFTSPAQAESFSGGYSLEFNCPANQPPSHLYNQAAPAVCDSGIGSVIATGPTGIAGVWGTSPATNLIRFSGMKWTSGSRYLRAQIWSRPEAYRHTPAVYSPAVAARTWPDAYPSYRQVPEVQLAPSPLRRPDQVGIEVDPDGDAHIRPVARARPGRKVKEGGKAAKSLAWKIIYPIYRVADAAGELNEVMRAIYQALPEHSRTKDPRKIFTELFLEGRILELSLAEIVAAILVNEVEDRIIGRLNALGDTRKRLGTSTSGFSSGMADVAEIWTQGEQLLGL